MILGIGQYNTENTGAKHKMALNTNASTHLIMVINKGYYYFLCYVLFFRT